MNDEIYRQLLSSREVIIGFNVGVRCAFHVLENADGLSPEGRKHLIEELMEKTADAERRHIGNLVRNISQDFD